MSWVCPMCSTNNEEFESKCIVCEYERALDKICTLTYNKVQKLGLSGNVVIPKEFNVVGEGAFKGRTDIYSVTIHDSVRKISKEAFSDCTNLKSIVCSHELETVGTKAFAECVSLPISERVKSKYIAKDAYSVTNKSNVKSNSFSTTHKSTVSDISYFGEDNSKKKIARILLLILATLILLPFVYLFFMFFNRGLNNEISIFIGVAIFFLFIVSIYFRCTNKDAKDFFRKTKIIIALVALFILYVIFVVSKNSLYLLTAFFSSALLTSELLCLGKLIRKKEYKFIAILICFIIINSVFIWQIFVL